jgi:hypothetical protein
VTKKFKLTHTKHVSSRRNFSLQQKKYIHNLEGVVYNFQFHHVMKLEASYILKILFTCNFIISTANVLDSLLVNNLLF